MPIHDFFAYDPAFLGGVAVAAGDVNGDGLADIITGAGPGGGPHVRVIDGATLMPIHDFFAYDPAFLGGVAVAAVDVNGDTRTDIVTGAGPGGGPHVRVFDAVTGSVTRELFAYAPDFTGGVLMGGTTADARALRPLLRRARANPRHPRERHVHARAGGVRARRLRRARGDPPLAARWFSRNRAPEPPPVAA